MEKIMTVEQVIRFKGTILVGILENAVQVGEIVNIGECQVRIFAIAGNLGKLVETAIAGDGVAMMFQGIKDVPVEKGWEITRT